MEQEIVERLARMEGEMKEVMIVVERTRKYFFWSMIASLVFFVLPLVGLLIAIPFFLNGYVGSLDSVGNLM